METEYRIVPNSKVTVVFVHGIIGSPVRFKDFFPLVPKEFSEIRVVLDGHGKKVRDFSKTSRKKWEEQIHNLLKDLKNKGQTVIYVGHSLGTLFALRESVSEKPLLDSMFLLNVPLHAKLGWTTIKQTMKCAFGKKEKWDEMTHCLAENCCIEISHNPFAYIGWLPRYFDLFQEEKLTREIIKNVTLPCVCVHSKKDELVRQSTLKILKKNPSFEIMVSENSGHYYFPKEDLDPILDRFTQLMNQQK